MSTPEHEERCFYCDRPLPPFGETEQCTRERDARHGVDYRGDGFITISVRNPQHRVEAFLRTWELQVQVPRTPLAEAVVAGAATLVLIPFVTAVATTLGNRLGQVVDDRLRKRLEGFLQQQVSESIMEQERAFFPADGEARVIVSVRLPPHALEQMMSLDFTALPAPPEGAGPPTVCWSGAHWIAACALPDRVHLRYWDGDTSAWKDGFPGPVREIPRARDD